MLGEAEGAEVVLFSFLSVERNRLAMSLPILSVWTSTRKANFPVSADTLPTLYQPRHPPSTAKAIVTSARSASMFRIGPSLSGDDRLSPGHVVPHHVPVQLPPRRAEHPAPP